MPGSSEIAKNLRVMTFMILVTLLLHWRTVITWQLKSFFAIWL